MSGESTMFGPNTLVVGVIDAEYSDKGVSLLVSGDVEILATPHRPVISLPYDHGLVHGVFWVHIQEVEDQLQSEQIYQIHRLAQRRERYGYQANVAYRWHGGVQNTKST